MWSGEEDSLVFERESRRPIDVEDSAVSLLLSDTWVQVDFSSTSKSAVLSLEYPELEKWTVDLSAQDEGAFQPMCMGGGSRGRVFFAGRLEGRQGSAIYSYQLHFEEGRPQWSSELVVHSPTIRDISAISNLSAFNGTLTVWDYGTARLLSLDLETLAVKKMLDSSERPELLNVLSMSSCSFEADREAGTPRGVGYFLQSGPRVRLVTDGSLWVNAKDYGANGSIDTYRF